MDEKRNCGMRNADCGIENCGLQIADCGLIQCGIKNCGLSKFGRRFFWILCFGLGLCAYRPFAAEPAAGEDKTSTTMTLLAPAQAEAALGQIGQKMGEVRSFEAAFTQDHHLAMFMDVLKASGRCFFAAPDKFRWEITAPYHSILVFNRDRVAKFEEKDGAMKYVESGAYDIIRGLMAQMTGWMRGDFKAGGDAFAMAALEGAKEYQLQLTPKSKEMQQYIRRIEVYINKNPLQTSRIVIREPEEDRIEIRFSEVRENAALDEKLFDVKQPLAVAGPDGKK